MLARSRSPMLAFVCATLASGVFAQGGYTTEKHPDLGLTFPRARDYEQVPTQPDEPTVVLQFVEKLNVDPRAGPKEDRPHLYVLWIDHVPDPPRVGPRTGDPKEPEEPDEPEDDEEGEGEDGPAPAATKAVARLPINSFDRFMQQRLRDFRASKPVEGKTRHGWTSSEYTLTLRKPAGGTSFMGWACVWSKPERSIVFMGLATSDDIVKHTKIWRASSDKVDFSEPTQMSTAKLEQMYARSKYSDVPFRIEVRKKLVRGWQAQDLDNYIVVYDTPDQPLMRKVFRDLELIRKEYEKLFPPEKPVTAVSTVRVCKNREEYLSYSGLPSSAGFWNSQTQELVLYDAEKVDRDWKKSDADTFIVLYHEAFHQYIHYSVGELPPHSWFDEGTGDYFSGAQLRDGKMRGIGVNPWRLELIQAVIERGLTVPWTEFVRYEQAQYYANAAICYAQGWSIIYFLRTCKEVAARPGWARILPTYFDVLKTAWREELEKLPEKKREEPGPRSVAGLQARTRAVDAAFEGVDFAEIEAAWKTYITALPVDRK